MSMFDGAKEITVEDIEAFLSDDGAVTPPADANTDPDQNIPPADSSIDDKAKSVDTTKAFAHRLKEATAKVRQEERENLAKSLGYEDYATMQKERENKLLEDKGLDPEDVAPVVEELVKKRLEEDPRLKELEEFRQKKIKDWAEKELVELSSLTSGKIKKFEDVSKEVIELWKQKGSLKAAYLELEGEKLIREIQTGIAGEQNMGTSTHLKNPTGTSKSINGDGTRPLTAEEKRVYKIFNPSISDEQLNKMTKKV